MRRFLFPSISTTSKCILRRKLTPCPVIFFSLCQFESVVGKRIAFAPSRLAISNKATVPHSTKIANLQWKRASLHAPCPHPRRTIHGTTAFIIFIRVSKSQQSRGISAASTRSLPSAVCNFQITTKKNCNALGSCGAARVRGKWGGAHGQQD